MLFFFSFLDIIVYLVQEYTCNYIDMPKNAGLVSRWKPLSLTVIKVSKYLNLTHLNLL